MCQKALSTGSKGDLRIENPGRLGTLVRNESYSLPAPLGFILSEIIHAESRVLRVSKIVFALHRGVDVDVDLDLSASTSI